MRARMASAGEILSAPLTQLSSGAKVFMNSRYDSAVRSSDQLASTSRRPMASSAATSSRIAPAATDGKGTADGATHTPGIGLPNPASVKAVREASRSAPFPISSSSKRPAQFDGCGL